MLLKNWPFSLFRLTVQYVFRNEANDIRVNVDPAKPVNYMENDKQLFFETNMTFEGTLMTFWAFHNIGVNTFFSQKGL
jgi:hypothetical protein